MIEEAISAGLVVDPSKVSLILGEQGAGYAPPDPDGTLHDSMTRGWNLVEHVPKPHWDGHQTNWRANRSKARTWSKAPWVHDAAWARGGGAYAKQLPPDAIPLSAAEASLVASAADAAESLRGETSGSLMP
jgi:hypothetical protein